MTKKSGSVNLNFVKLQVKMSIVCCLLSVALLLSLNLAASAPPKSDWEYYQKGGHKDPKWDALVEAGFGAFDSSNFDTAINFMERAKALGCKDGLLLYKLATYTELLGNTKDAITLLKEAEPILRNRYPKHPATIQLSEHLAGLYYQAGKYDDALPEYLSAIRTQGENFLRLYLVGQMYRMKKDTKNAIPYFENALKQPEQNSLRPLAQIELIKLYFDDKSFDKSLAMANQILEQDPQNPIALSYRDEIAHRKTQEKEREVMKRIIEKQ